MTTDANMLEILKIQKDIEVIVKRLNSISKTPRMNPNFSGTPGTGDDEDDGYSVLSMVYNGTNVYVCTSASAGAATWVQIN